MSSLVPRGRKLYAKLQDFTGKWKQVRTDFYVGQEDQARAWIIEREREVERDRRLLNGKPVAPVLTVNAWAETWDVKRVKLGNDSNHDYARLKLHVLPVIGEMPIAEVEAKHLVDLFDAIRTTPLESTGKPPAPRTVYNVYSALSSMFRDARFAGHVKQSPCILTSLQLGEKLDADLEWRNDAVLARAEVETLISIASIPWNRRVAYAVELLGGLRPGENAAIRIKHYDRTRRPLGGLFVGSSLNSKRGKVKGTKTQTTKWIPVHATLAAMLDEWIAVGWAEMMGRAPTPDDLLVPIPPADAEARTKRRDAEPFRTTYYARRRWVDDLAALGWRHRRHYDTRATFVTLALEDGADPDVIERRVTHSKKSRSAFDGYDRGVRWAVTCAEVAKLKIARTPDSVTWCNVVQAKETLAMSSTSGLRRRVSKPSLATVLDDRCEQLPPVERDEVSTVGMTSHGLHHDHGATTYAVALAESSEDPALRSFAIGAMIRGLQLELAA